MQDWETLTWRTIEKAAAETGMSLAALRSAVRDRLAGKDGLPELPSWKASEPQPPWYVRSEDGQIHLHLPMELVNALGLKPRAKRVAKRSNAAGARRKSVPASGRRTVEKAADQPVQQPAASETSLMERHVERLERHIVRLEKQLDR